MMEVVRRVVAEMEVEEVTGEGGEVVDENEDEGPKPPVIGASKPLRATYGLLALASVSGMCSLCFQSKAVDKSELVMALAFLGYSFLVYYKTNDPDEASEFISITPNRRLLRLLMPISLLVSLILPGIYFLLSSNPATRKCLGPPIFWFFAERALEWFTNRPSVNIFSRLVTLYVIEFYHLYVVYLWYIASFEFGPIMQVIALTNLIYWTTAVLGYLVLYVGGEFFDGGSMKRQLEDLD